MIENIFGIIVISGKKNLLINCCFWVVKIIGIVGKLWNYGIINNLLVCGFFENYWNIFLVILL